MIQYSLKCSDGHEFESWFKSADAFDVLAQAGHVVCAHCGSSDVEKAIMAPRVSANVSKGAQRRLTEPQSDSEKAVAEFRKHIEKNADYVGPRFAEEARSMHVGTTPERAIYGEVNRTEAKALIDDGVPVAPLPFVPNRKAN